MKYYGKLTIIYASLAAVLVGCGGSPLISTPIENIDSSPLKVSELTEAEKENWGHLDLEKDTIPGMGVDRAYGEVIKGKKGKKVIVAVIDSGIDIDHEDLDNVIWTNEDEIANNGKDDDKNGYVDDINGWNFLGEGYDEQLEYVRLIASDDKSNPRYAEAAKLYEEEYSTWTGRKTQYDQIYQQVINNDEILSKHLGKKDYTKDDVNNISSTDQSIQGAVQFAKFIYANGIESMTDAKKELSGALESINDHLNYNLNKDLNGRKTGDNPNDFNDKPGYGNGNIKPVKKSESHGTHVAGIIAAERNNGKGANGVANNVQIMVIRAVPNGDEYDKDIAKAIRYAVDNGASIINGSFGKSFSPHSDWVHEAIKYAADNDVLIVHAAGNDSKDIDVEPNFPTDNINGKEVADNYISVGALAPKYGSSMKASFSNYGDQNVDVFAPGAQVYSTTPESEYDTKGGTSMAAPAVAGLAALIRSYYPKLKATQVKGVILNSGLELNTKVVVGGDAKDVRPFAELSKSGRIANAYNALIMASKL
ncbi:MAG: S8 family serine peptidase [Winogradskyella sp.]|uniref:S8 family peptidase n=1 Tax=Winogradskyella sp. TaxID=1883156 RepID=UPI0017D28165|nr:S8 family peptidase [Winogradskyella sp.]MBT8245458.1 S8 family peptidase [Winogradskyella sp.]NNK22305.1 S8 family serine peptidase [Winogradskyella sp.]